MDDAAIRKLLRGLVKPHPTRAGILTTDRATVLEHHPEALGEVEAWVLEYADSEVTQGSTHGPRLRAGGQRSERVGDHTPGTATYLIPADALQDE